MNKCTLLLLTLVCASLQAQNPDGKDASLHITPTWLWGKGTYNRNMSIFYPQSELYPPMTVTFRDSGGIQYPYAFGINVMLKVPASSYLTMSLSYSFNQRYEEDKEYYHYLSLNGNMHKISFTASIYNLFSIY